MRRFLLAAALPAAALLLLTANAGETRTAQLAAPTLPEPPVVPAPTLEPVTSAVAPATVQRTFVSTSGSDASPCSATAPCRSFIAALAQTTPGGEVVALTSGGYGPVAVGMSVTIVGAPGVHAAITATNGSAVIVAAGAGDTVVLRNLYLNSLGAAVGVFYWSGRALHLEGLTINGFDTAGVLQYAVGGRLYATDVAARDGDYGFLVDPLEGQAHVTLDRVRAEHNANVGILNNQNARMRVSDCIVSGNEWGIVAHAATLVSGCQISENWSTGFAVGWGAIAWIGGSTVTANGLGLENSGGGSTLLSFGDNLVSGNTSNTSGTIITIAKT